LGNPPCILPLGVPERNEPFDPDRAVRGLQDLSHDLTSSLEADWAKAAVEEASELFLRRSSSIGS
jgi:hypothetical protein